MRLSKILETFNQIAPESLAEPWDKVGLQVGDPKWQVRRGVLCIDLTESVLREAIASRANLIVAYHPPIFSPLEGLTSGEPKQRLILEAATRKIAIYSPHTALDAAAGGVNDWLSEGIGKGNVRPIKVAPDDPPRSYKVVTFVPHPDADRVRASMAQHGAGRIGHYTQCSFVSPGQGTFWGDRSTSPAVGRSGRLERVEEARLEMVCSGADLPGVITAMQEAHPYEQVAYDVYPIEPVATTPGAGAVGQGRVIDLDRPISPATLVRRIKRHLGVRSLNAGVPVGLKQVRRVGLCAGAGGSLCPAAGEIDAFVTGEMRHHDILAAVERGVCVVLPGHTQTERPYLRIYRERLGRLSGRTVAWSISKADTPPDLRV